jgi:hypothetical protein
VRPRPDQRAMRPGRTRAGPSDSRQPLHPSPAEQPLGDWVRRPSGIIVPRGCFDPRERPQIDPSRVRARVFAVTAVLALGEIARAVDALLALVRHVLYILNR